MTSSDANAIAEPGLAASASGESSRTLDEAHVRKSSGFLSSKTTTTRDKVDETLAVASSLAAERIDLVAGNNIGVKGANVVATHDVSLNAGNNVKLDAAITDTTESHLKVEKTSGLFSGGGIGVTLGTRQLSVDNQSTHETATSATIGSTAGNVTNLA